MAHQLYRHWGKNGDLLYVGISLSAVNRLSQHKDSFWFDEIEKVTIESFANREVLKLAEIEAIRNERPLHNKIFNTRRENIIIPKTPTRVDFFNGRVVSAKPLFSHIGIVNPKTYFLMREKRKDMPPVFKYPGRCVVYKEPADHYMKSSEPVEKINKNELFSICDLLSVQQVKEITGLDHAEYCRTKSQDRNFPESFLVECWQAYNKHEVFNYQNLISDSLLTEQMR